MSCGLVESNGGVDGIRGRGMLQAVVCALLAAAAALDDGCAMATVKVGVIGAGANTKSRHIPGLQAISGVEVTSVCACPHLPLRLAGVRRR